MLGSQSSKLKKATLGISGDPRFRLTSTVPHSPLIILSVFVAALATAVVVMVVSNGALAVQENVVAVADCVAQVRGALEPHKHVLDEVHAAAAATCLASHAAIGESEPDALVAKVVSGLTEAQRIHKAGPVEAEVEVVRDLHDRVEDFYRWYVQNKARFGIH